MGKKRKRDGDRGRDIDRGGGDGHHAQRWGRGEGKRGTAWRGALLNFPMLHQMAGPLII